MLNINSYQEMQTKTTVRYHFTPTYGLTIIKRQIISIREDVERNESSHTIVEI